MAKAKPSSNGQTHETHQVAGPGDDVLTTRQGLPVADDQNTLRAGVRGPSLLEDFHFREKIFHFDHERIPERVVHARGFGAHGYFENYEPQAKLAGVDPSRQSYRDGYRTAAMFLAWIEAMHGKGVVPRLNEALRKSQYRYDLFKQLTGKSLDRLWADFLEDKAARGR